MSSLPEFCTPPQAAEILGRDPDTVRGWIESGELPASNLASRSATRPRWLISREALEEFLAAREPRPAIKRKRSSDRVIKFF